MPVTTAQDSECPNALVSATPALHRGWAHVACALRDHQRRAQAEGRHAASATHCASEAVSGAAADHPVGPVVTSPAQGTRCRGRRRRDGQGRWLDERVVGGGGAALGLAAGVTGDRWNSCCMSTTRFCRCPIESPPLSTAYYTQTQTLDSVITVTQQ